MRLRHKIQKASAAKGRKDKKLAKKVFLDDMAVKCFKTDRNAVEPRMAIEAEEGSGYSQSIPIQRQDPSRNRRHQAEEGGGAAEEER